jgi:anthranilate phosphoribosyltransferase
MLRESLSAYIDTPATHMLCFNAGAALFACDLVPSLPEGVKLAQATLREGKANRKLTEVIEHSQTLG